MMKNPYKIMIPLLFILLSVGTILPAYALSASKEEDPYDELQLMTDVMAIIRRHYVDEVPMKTMVDGAIRGILSTLDPHSSFLSPDDYQEIKSDMSGQFVGLGLDVTIKTNELVVIAPVEGSPADQAGILSGDRILKINEQSTTDIDDVLTALRLMRGDKGSQATLTIMREGFDAPKEFNLQRDLIKVVSVRSRTLEPGYGYLRIAQFQETTFTEVEKSLSRLHQENPGELNGLIVDLRNNTGGLLDQAVKVSNLFIESGLIVYTEGRDQGNLLQFTAQKTGTEPDYSIILLINGGSASASEIVAGALKDHSRALLLGTPTFGKGTVQTIIPLRNDNGLRLTTARYFTPLGTSIQAQGITPDITVYAQKDIPHGSTGKGFKEKDLPHHIAAMGGETANKLSHSLNDDPESIGETIEDNQLQYALDILKGGHLLKLQALKKNGQG